MPISAPGRTEAGLTLVELLVVLLIIGMAAGMVVLAVPRGPSDLAKVSLQIERDVAALRESAVTDVSHFGVVPLGNGYALYAAREGVWSLVATRQAPPSVSVEIAAEGGWALPEHSESISIGPKAEAEKDAVEPAILFAPDGTVTPFSIRLRMGRDDAVIRVDPFGRLVEDADA